MFIFNKYNKNNIQKYNFTIFNNPINIFYNIKYIFHNRRIVLSFLRILKIVYIYAHFISPFYKLKTINNLNFNFIILDYFNKKSFKFFIS